MWLNYYNSIWHSADIEVCCNADLLSDHYVTLAGGLIKGIDEFGIKLFRI
jgi:hypothetical protein